MKINCNSIIVTQKYDEGILSGPHLLEFLIDDNISVVIEQNLIRTTKIMARKQTSFIKLYECFDLLDKLIMLFDGVFIPVKSINVYDGSKDISELPEIQNFLNRRIVFTSNDIFINNSKFCNWYDCINTTVYYKWESLYNELEIVHQVVLYNSGNLKYPVDGKVANLIEICESLVDIINIYTARFNELHPGEKDTSLRKCIDSLISEYGMDIFSKEYQIKREEFLSISTKSRIRIMHIKRKYPQVFFNGAESLVYLAKFTFLYRHVLLQLMDIDYSNYNEQLIEHVNRLDSLNEIVDNMLKRI